MIPKYIVINIKNIYEASKETLGSPLKVRKSNFINILKAYYKWEPKRTLESFYKTIEHREEDYYSKKRIKELVEKHGSSIQRLFGALDKDSSSCIDFEEFMRIATHFGSDAVQAFQNADINEDGVLSYDEFYNLVCKNKTIYKQIDTMITSLVLKEEEEEKFKKSTIFKCYEQGKRPSLADLKYYTDVKKSQMYLM